jgi:hypothetical protein
MTRFVKSRSRLGRRVSSEGVMISQSDLESVYLFEGEPYVVVPSEAAVAYPVDVEGQGVLRYIWWMVFTFLVIVSFVLGALVF